LTQDLQVDVLAVGVHPDDVELGLGGLLHKLSASGYSVGILNLTRGEMSTNGNIEQREREAAEASRILGIARRETAALPDSAIANIRDQQMEIIPFLRSFRPRLLLSLMSEDRHPDHHAAHELMRDAAFFAGLARLDTGQKPYRPPHIYYYHPYHESSLDPAMVVDITAHIEAKLAAIQAYESQFHNPTRPGNGNGTYIGSAGFWESIRHRAAYWGRRAGFEYGEPLFAAGPLGVHLPPGLEKP